MVYQTLHADIYLEGDIAESLEPARCAGERSRREDRSWHGGRAAAALDARARELCRGPRAERDKAQNGSGIDPLSLLGALGEVMPADTIYVDETITHSPMVRQHLPQTMPQSFFRGSGGLGQGIGTALGIKLAARERPVVLLVGDGSFLYNPIIQALGASKRHDLPIIIIVLNNKKYEAMRKGHVHHYPDGASASKDLHFGVTIDGPEYDQLGSHFGFHGQRVEKLAELKRALKARSPPPRAGRRRSSMCT